AGTNGYTTTSGTSFASPLTAGVIGLLYSVSCNDFMNLVKLDPQAGADLIRDALYDGVDVIPGLVGEVATGGRINTFNSLQLLVDNCTDAPDCAPGMYNNNGVCTLCPAGSYCPGDGAAYLCPEGSFQSFPGMISCQSCAAGTFSNITGATTCSNCPAGTYQDESGSTECEIGRASCRAG